LYDPNLFAHKYPSTPTYARKFQVELLAEKAKPKPLDSVDPLLRLPILQWLVYH
jgi:hypothetical protein